MSDTGMKRTFPRDSTGMRSRYRAPAPPPAPVLAGVFTVGACPPASCNTASRLSRRRLASSSRAMRSGGGGCSGIAGAPALGRRVIGEANLHERAPTFIRVQRKSLARSIELREASARIRQTYTFTHRVRRAAAVVAYCEHEVAVVAHGAHRDAPDGLHLREPVPKRVFDERL